MRHIAHEARLAQLAPHHFGPLIPAGWPPVGKKEVEQYRQKHDLKNVISLPYQPLSELRYSLSSADVHVVSLGDKINIPLKVGKEVTLELLRPGASQPLSLTGKVTSSITLAQAAEQRRAAGMGIKFDPVPPHLHVVE